LRNANKCRLDAYSASGGLQRWTLIEVDFDGSLGAQAYRAIIGKALDDARQTLRSTAKMQDDLKVPVAHVPDPQVIGRWKIEL
jgi:hypothetical protein